MWSVTCMWSEFMGVALAVRGMTCDRTSDLSGDLGSSMTNSGAKRVDTGEFGAAGVSGVIAQVVGGSSQIVEHGRLIGWFEPPRTHRSSHVAVPGVTGGLVDGEVHVAHP
jgi:hypothetical protein